MNLLLESVIDYTLDYYSPYVFANYKEKLPKIREDLLHKIKSDVAKVNKLVKVKDFFIKGSILTKKYSKNSDIDIYIIINRNEDIDEQKLSDVWSEINEKKFKNIPHPLQYYISSEEYNINRADAVYNLRTNEWLKIDAPRKDINIDDYFEEFQEYISKFSDFSEDLRQSMIDMEILKELPPDSLKNLNNRLKDKLQEIEDACLKIVNTYTQLKNYRNLSFKEDMSPEEIKKYGVKTNLPANVIFKLLERYYYRDLSLFIKKLLGSDKKLDYNEYEILNNVLRTKLTKESNRTSFKDIFQEKDMFGRVEHRQQKLTAGLRNTGNRKKSQNILPAYQRSNPNKNVNKTKNVKNTHSKVITVNANSTYGKYLIQKYRIGDPTGEKIVAGNQNDGGIKINFV